MTPADVADIRLIHPRTLLIDEPFLGGYYTKSGLYIQFAELLPKIYTYVIKTHKCESVKVGDTIMFLPNHTTDYYLADGRRIWAMDERAVQAVMEEW
jgi:ABC-type nitrate/sulfonate/bicarbonate transport system ATPase subunit